VQEVIHHERHARICGRHDGGDRFRGDTGSRRRGRKSLAGHRGGAGCRRWSDRGSGGGRGDGTGEKSRVSLRDDGLHALTVLSNEGS
jgi:hypothetical protein